MSVCQHTDRWINQSINQVVTYASHGENLDHVVRHSYRNQHVNINMSTSTCQHVNIKGQTLAVPWLRRLVAGLLPRSPGFDAGSVHVGFVVNRVALGQVFHCQFHSTGAPLHVKTKKLSIFITKLHNKPEGCGASVASAAGHLKKG